MAHAHNSNEYYLLMAEMDGERWHPMDCACYFSTLEEAATYVDRLEETGLWEEGADAVCVKEGKAWLYADGWEEI